MSDEPKGVVDDDPDGPGSYTLIEDSVLEDGSLSLGAFKLWCVLRKHARQKGECFPGQARLAKTLGCTEKSVRTYASELRERGLVTIERRGASQSLMYRLQRPNVRGPEPVRSLRPVPPPDEAETLDADDVLPPVATTQQPVVVTEQTPVSGPKDPPEPVVATPRNRSWRPPNSSELNNTTELLPYMPNEEEDRVRDTREQPEGFEYIYERMCSIAKAKKTARPKPDCILGLMQEFGHKDLAHHARECEWYWTQGGGVNRTVKHVGQIFRHRLAKFPDPEPIPIRAKGMFEAMADDPYRLDRLQAEARERYGSTTQRL